MKALESLGFVAAGDYSAYVKFNMFKGRYYRIKGIILAVMLTLACLILAFYGLATGNKGFIIAAGALLLCCAMFGYIIKVNVRNYCKSRASLVRAKQKVIFGKNGLVHELMLSPESEINEYFYDSLLKVYDTRNAIYLYFDTKSVIILPKRNLNMSPAEARSFLQSFIPAQKLVVCI